MKNADKFNKNQECDFFRSVLNSSLDPIFVKDNDDHFVFVNKAFAKIFELPEDKLLGKKFRKLFPETYSDNFFKANRMAIESGLESTIEEKLIVKDGKTLQVSLKRSRYLDEKGNKYLINVMRDISESKRLANKLSEEFAFSNAVVESISGPFYMLDEKGQYLRWNGYESDEIIGKPDWQITGMNMLDTVHPGSRAAVKAEIDSVLMGGIDEAVEARLLLSGGPTFRWFLLNGRRIIHEGKPALIGVGADITGYKNAEEELAKIKSVIEIMNLGFYEVDSDEKGKILNCNDALARIFELDSREDLIGTYSADFYADLEDRKKQTKKIIESPLLLNSQVNLKTAKGRIINTKMSIVMTKDVDNHVRFVGLIEEIPEGKGTEETA